MLLGVSAGEFTAAAREPPGTSGTGYSPSPGSYSRWSAPAASNRFISRLRIPKTRFSAGGFIGQYSATGLGANFATPRRHGDFLTLLIVGITLAAHVSWFNLMDRVGYGAFAIAAAIAAAVKVLSEKRADRKEGTKVRKQRRVSVKKIRAELSERKPPTIAPRASTPVEGEREQQERQQNLFPDSATGGGLPKLSLLDPPARYPAGYSRDELESMSQLLVKKLKDFNVEITVEAVQPGPVITRLRSSRRRA